MERILHTGMTDNLGGIETFIINYYRKLDKKKYQFDFINIYDNNLYYQEEIEKLGGKVYKVASYYHHPIKYMKELIKIIKDNNYNIVHCNMNSAVFILPLIAAKISGVKIIISHAHNSSNDKGIMKTLLHNIMRHFIPFFANRFVACSDKAGEWFYSRKIRKSSKYYILDNAVDIDKFKFNNEVRLAKRKELGIKDSEILIGHVGRFNKQKNHGFIIEIFNELNKKSDNYKLVLIGIGPLIEEMKEKVNYYKLNDKVIFLGQRNDVNEIMNAVDIFILPSLYEGLPIVAVEAQANGLYCLLSDTITKEVIDTKNVDFISIEDPKLWADKITIFKQDNHNRNVVLSKYNIENSIKTLYNLYCDEKR